MENHIHKTVKYGVATFTREPSEELINVVEKLSCLAYENARGIEEDSRALTVKQPWASLIVCGIKDIENRTWKTNFRGRVLIHAGLGWSKYQAEICISNQIKLHLEKLGYIHKYPDENIGYKGFSFSFPHSSIIGSVEIIDCVTNHPSLWAEKGFWNWVLANPIIFYKPIENVKGRLGIWKYK
jgi:hypothetical protein